MRLPTEKQTLHLPVSDSFNTWLSEVQSGYTRMGDLLDLIDELWVLIGDYKSDVTYDTDEALDLTLPWGNFEDEPNAQVLTLDKAPDGTSSDGLDEAAGGADAPPATETVSPSEPSALAGEVASGGATSKPSNPEPGMNLNDALGPSELPPQPAMKPLDSIDLSSPMNPSDGTKINVESPIVDVTQCSSKEPTVGT